MKRKGLTIVALCLVTVLIFPMRAVNAEREKRAAYSTMALIAQSKRLENVVMPIKGYVKFEKKGTIIYLGEEDYIHDTKENAVWFPQREEQKIEMYWEEGKPQNGSRIVILGIVQPSQKDSPYAAEALYYIGEEDEAYQKAKEEPSRTELYNRGNEKEQAARISIYRLLGDPWTYDGKKVCVVDVVDDQEGAIMPLRNWRLPADMLLTSSVNGEEAGYVEAWKPLIAEYTSVEPYKSLDAERRRYCVEMGAYYKHVRMEMEMMFYMHNPDDWFNQRDEGGQMLLRNIQYSYWPCLVKINQKDIEEFKEGMMECYYMVKDK